MNIFPPISVVLFDRYYKKIGSKIKTNKGKFFFCWHTHQRYEMSLTIKKLGNFNIC